MLYTTIFNPHDGYANCTLITLSFILILTPRVLSIHGFSAAAVFPLILYLCGVVWEGKGGEGAGRVGGLCVLMAGSTFATHLTDGIFKYT